MIGGALALLAQLTISVAAPDTMGPEPAWVTVRVSAPSVRPPRVIPPSFAPFTVGRTTASSATEHSGGISRVQVEMRYELRAERAGVFIIPPFEARWSSEHVRSDPITIVVRRATGSAIPRVITEGRIDTTVAVSVASRVIPDTVYVGEQSTYQVGVFIDESIRSRLRRNPGFNPPEMRGMLAYDVQPDRGTLPSRVVGDKRYEAHVYQRAVFPLLAGRHVIPSSQLHYSLPLSYSFFSREESHVLRTDSLVLVARELPEEGKPAEFTGAVGEFQVEAQLDASRLRVGDPVRLMVRVSGAGNIKLLPRPKVEVPWATAIPGSERVRVGSTIPRVEGVKEFEWILTPLAAGAQELPPIEYPYFDPYTSRYETAITRPAPVSVGAGALVADEFRDESQALPLRTNYRGSPPPAAHMRTGFWLLLLVAPFPALAMIVVRRPRPVRLRTAADSLRELARGRRPHGAMDVRRAYAAALIERLHLRPNALATRTEFVRVMKRSGVSQETAVRAEKLLTRLDTAAFAGTGGGGSASAREALDVFRAVDAEARTRASLAAALAPLVLLLVVSATLIAEPLERARAYFQEGIASYEWGDYSAAVDEFAEVVRIEPGAPDGWANFGTAGWEAGDTAAAVVGWQRALRLEPGATDVRERLTLHSAAPSMRSHAWVPPASSGALALLAAGFWVLGWLLVLMAVLRQGAHGTAGAAAIALSLLVGGGAVVVDERLAAEKLVAARENTVLRTAPALASQARVRVRSGDIAKKVQQRGAWIMVELDGGLAGWIHTSELIPLRRD